MRAQLVARTAWLGALTFIVACYAPAAIGRELGVYSKRYGEAMVTGSSFRPWVVENALYPDGSRGEARNTPDHGFRRRATGDRLWIYGRIDIRPDDVVFIDGEQPQYQPPAQGETANLEADLARDPAFLAAIRDDRFALAVLAVFTDKTFYKGDNPQLWWHCLAKQAAVLVANLRGMGESYMDYLRPYAAFNTHPVDVLKALHADLSRLGWHIEDEQDRERLHQEWLGRALQVLHEVKELEQRPAAQAGLWTKDSRLQYWLTHFRSFPETRSLNDERVVEIGQLDRRVAALALSGRIDEQEYRALFQRSVEFPWMRLPWQGYSEPSNWQSVDWISHGERNALDFPKN